MNIVIAGAGEVGFHVARVLAAGGHALTVIDMDVHAIDRAEEGVDALTLRGPADCPTTLREARVGEADLFAALTGSGSTNLLSGIMARDLGAARVVARVRERHYFETEHGVYPGFMGLDLVVNEQAVVAAELSRLARAHGASVIERFADHRLEALELPVDEEGPGVNRPLAELDLGRGVVVAAIRRRDTVLIPNPADMIHVGDDIVIVGPTLDIGAAEQLFARERRRYNQKTVLVGGGGIGSEVARTLEAEGTQVVLIEREAERCEALANELSNATILRGDGTDLEVLNEAGAADADVFCALSDADEVNLMAALLARDTGSRRCVTLVHKPDYVAVCHHLGLENTVSPRLVVAREIIRQLRTGAVVHSAPVLEGAATVIELQVAEISKVAGHVLREIVLPRGALAISHVRGGEVRPATPDTAIEAGDHLVLLVKEDARRGLGRAVGAIIDEGLD